MSASYNCFMSLKKRSHPLAFHDFERISDFGNLVRVRVISPYLNVIVRRQRSRRFCIVWLSKFSLIIKTTHSILFILHKKHAVLATTHLIWFSKALL